MSTTEKPQGPLIWIDLEMTGLDTAHDRILEIATLITNDSLEIIAEGPNLVINCPPILLQTMDQWCHEQHAKSGLTQAAMASNLSLEQAEQLTVEFLTPLVAKGKGILCGNSIWQDRLFINQYMPTLLTFFHYKMIDVSSLKEVITRWYPNTSTLPFKKSDTHRALPDILESIQELRFYRDNFFIKNSY